MTQQTIEAASYRSGASLRGRYLLLAGIMLVALNLRPALASVSPLLIEIKAALPLSAVGARWLTTIPVLCFGIASAVAPRLGRQWGSERTVAVMMACLTAGLALRCLGVDAVLFAGTILGAAAIGVTGVLLPALFKREFPDHVGLVTGLYTMALAIGSAAAAGLTAPIERLTGTDWRVGLGTWALLPLPALLFWLPQLRTRTAAAVRKVPSGLLRSPLAWAVTAFMGLQSAMFYAVLAWLPVILQEHGATVIESGYVLSLSVVVQIAVSPIVPVLAGRRPGQGGLAAVLLTTSLAGFLGCLYGGPLLVWPAAILLGIGQGGLFGLALMMVVLRSPDATVAASLSGMSQSVGYCFAALGPFGAGAVRDWSGGWNGVAILFAGAVLLTFLIGLKAGAPALIGERR
ncbi:MAG TPA: MFS transporter [Aliidongia sp.]|nr:MFS transporter [Aliidongia sp.]